MVRSTGKKEGCKMLETPIEGGYGRYGIIVGRQGKYLGLLLGLRKKEFQ